MTLVRRLERNRQKTAVRASLAQHVWRPQRVWWVCRRTIRFHWPAIRAQAILPPAGLPALSAAGRQRSGPASAACSFQSSYWAAACEQAATGGLQGCYHAACKSLACSHPQLECFEWEDAEASKLCTFLIHHEMNRALRPEGSGRLAVMAVMAGHLPSTSILSVCPISARLLVLQRILQGLVDVYDRLLTWRQQLLSSPTLHCRCTP